MTKYQIGYRFELKARDYWRRKGWSCDRTPASKTPYDLTVVKAAGNRWVSVLRVQCQKSLPFSRKKVKALIDWCYKECTHPLLMWNVNGKCKVRHAFDYLVEGK